jgi:hypothetical protein
MAEQEQPVERDPASAMRQLRLRTLTTPPADYGIIPTSQFPRVYGVVMDWGMEGFTISVVSLADGNASLYTTSTFGVIGGLGHSSVRDAALRFVTAAARYFDDGVPVREYPYPVAGRVRFYFLSFQGVRVIETSDEVFQSRTAKYSDLGTLGQQLITEFRQITESRKSP